MSNSDNYNMYIATIGENDLNTGVGISKQPYAGVMVKSHNSSTWTADQNSDVKFRIHRAQFDIDTAGVLYMENESLDDRILPNNPLTSELGSQMVTVRFPRHNFIVGGTIALSGALATNGFVTGDINKNHVITDIISKDEIEIDVGVIATASGSFGGSVAMCSNTIQASLIMPNVSDIKLPRTNISFEFKGTSGKSVSGTEIPYQIQSTWTKIENKENFELSQPIVITSDVDETINIAGNKSIAMKVTLTSDNVNISPVVDIDSCSVVTPSYLINYEETKLADASNNYANSRTLPITLSQAATGLKVFIDLSRPQDTEIFVFCRTG
jgi:hypothetical protein